MTIYTMARDSLVTFVVNDSLTSHGHHCTRIRPPHYIIGNSLSQEDQFLWFLIAAMLNRRYWGASRSCYCSLEITQTIKKAQENLLGHT